MTHVICQFAIEGVGNETIFVSQVLRLHACLAPYKVAVICKEQEDSNLAMVCRKYIHTLEIHFKMSIF